MRCPKCHEPAPSEATHCRLCGEPFPRRIEDELTEERRRANASLTAPSEGPARYKPNTAKAIRFLLSVLLLQGVPAFMWFGAAWMQRHSLGLGDTGIPADSPMVQGALIVIFFVGNAYLVAKTGESLGASFWLNFLMACLPPFLPAVWARIGGKSVLRPYAFLLADAVVVILAALMVRDTVLISIIAGLIIVPLAFYQLFGCAVREVSTPLGLNSEMALIWICFGPLALVIVLLLEGAHDLIANLYSESLAQFLAAAGDLMNVDFLMRASTFQTLLGLYLVASWIIWIRAVYNGLKLPVM